MSCVVTVAHNPRKNIASNLPWGIELCPLGGDGGIGVSTGRFASVESGFDADPGPIVVSIKPTEPKPVMPLNSCRHRFAIALAALVFVSITSGRACAQFIESDALLTDESPLPFGMLEPPSTEELPQYFEEDFEGNRFDDAELPVPRFRKSWFQGLLLSSGWLSDTSEDGLGISHLDVQLRTGLPLGSLDNILAISPSFRVDTLSGPRGIDVPGALYETGVNFFWIKQLSPRWGARVSVAPMVRSDFTTSDGALRVFSLGLLIWKWVPEELELSFGVVSLGRDDIPVLPALGLVWTPSPLWKIEAIFPRPRIAYRLDKDGPRAETWVYFAGALGGNSWAVSRQSGETDQLSIRDFRAMLGVERVKAGGSGFFAETGWVFGRELEYEKQGVSLEFDQCLALQGGVTF